MLQFITGLFMAMSSQAVKGGARHVVVDTAGDIINSIMIDPNLPAEQQWPVPAGCRLIAHEQAGVGWRVVDGALVDTRPPPPGLGPPDVD